MAHAAEILIPKDEINQRFAIARSIAISSYGSYENSLANLFTYFMGTAPDIAGISFFKINNARSRLAILGRLLKKRHGSEYNLFWNSIEKLLKPFDSKRNEIVHWAVVTWINSDIQPGGAVTDVKLTPPNFWDQDENSPEITINDLYDFIVKANFFSRVLNVFHRTISGEYPVSPAWREISLQPVIYPPPSNHPLCQN